VLEVSRVDSTTITPPPPMVRGLAAEYIAGIIARPNRTIIMLQAGKLLSSRERIALREAAAASQPVAAAAGGGKRGRKS
jgi:purine-binding chemotaxis protein CheW